MASDSPGHDASNFASGRSVHRCFTPSWTNLDNGIGTAAPEDERTSERPAYYRVLWTVNHGVEAGRRSRTALTWEYMGTNNPDHSRLEGFHEVAVTQTSLALNKRWTTSTRL